LEAYTTGVRERRIRVCNDKTDPGLLPLNLAKYI
jgi:hypothetical protein